MSNYFYHLFIPSSYMIIPVVMVTVNILFQICNYKYYAFNPYPANVENMMSS